MARGPEEDAPAGGGGGPPGRLPLQRHADQGRGFRGGHQQHPQLGRGKGRTINLVCNLECHRECETKYILVLKPTVLHTRFVSLLSTGMIVVVESDAMLTPEPIPGRLFCLKAG